MWGQQTATLESPHSCSSLISSPMCCSVQGPVEKFYGAMYRKTPYLSEPLQPVRSIRLWSDWNNGIRKWAEQRVTDAKAAPGGNSFRYLNIHTEDLVSEDVARSHSAIRKIASYVGSGGAAEKIGVHMAGSALYCAEP